MKSTILIPFFAGLLCFWGTACKDEPVHDHLAPLDGIPEQQYFESDPFADRAHKFYGKWQVVGTSGGLFGQGYTPDFDYLLLKPNGIFGIVRNDSLINSGKVLRIEDDDFDLLVHFIAEPDSLNQEVYITWDYEKYVVFRSDSMSLYSPCCDRFDTHLKRVQ